MIWLIHVAQFVTQLKSKYFFFLVSDLVWEGEALIEKNINILIAGRSDMSFDAYIFSHFEKNTLHRISEYLQSYFCESSS
jgi:hypothetical protein